MKKQKGNKCPVGGKFGLDVGEWAECNKCKVNSQCYTEHQKINDAVPDDSSDDLSFFDNPQHKSLEKPIAVETDDDEIRTVPTEADRLALLYPQRQQPVAEITAKPTDVVKDEATKCPAGAKFGCDIDEHPECNNCSIWAECASGYQLLSGNVPAGTAVAIDTSLVTDTPTFEHQPVGMTKKQCDGHQFNPLSYDCSVCKKIPICRKYFGLYSRIPRYIIEDYLMTLSPSAFKVFVFLNHKANFDPQSNHYGRCWPTDEQIEAGTNVKKSNMNKYRKELKKHNLISFDYTLHRGDDGKCKTSHLYTVTWLLKQRVYQIE